MLLLHTGIAATICAAAAPARMRRQPIKAGAAAASRLVRRRPPPQTPRAASAPAVPAPRPAAFGYAPALVAPAPRTDRLPARHGRHHSSSLDAHEAQRAHRRRVPEPRPRVRGAAQPHRSGGKTDSPGPGPGQYNVTGLSAKGKDNPPASSLHSRPKEIKTAQTPAPGDYNPEKSDKIVHASPKFTFGLKTQPGKPSTTPAPNVYNIPTVLGATKEGNKKQAPAFTISGRQKEKMDDRINNPGPGSYNDAKADNYKIKSPAYSISSRYQMPQDPTPKPGPGAHSPEKVRLDTIPAHTFGIKHSQYMGVLKAHTS
ncbi:uncharacterized protein GBIM_00314 [Gryllus bimaculatus]|nr:uncharacterized protein GBIM_00314 [Gryllus bimaculatus]